MPRCWASEVNQVWLPVSQAWRCDLCHRVWRDPGIEVGRSRYARIQSERARQRWLRAIVLGLMALGATAVAVLVLAL